MGMSLLTGLLLVLVLVVLLMRMAIPVSRSVSKVAFSYTLIALLTLVFSLAACNPSDSLSPSGNLSSGSLLSGSAPQTVRIGYQIIPNAEVLAKSLGLVEEAFPDTQIQWRAFPAGWKINEAMLAGDVDIGLVGSLPVSTAIAQNLPLKVYIIHNIIDKNAALAVTKDSGIRSLGDLPGKRIAVPFGSTSHFSLLAALEQFEIESEDVQILDMSLPELTAAWENNTIDGSFVWQTTLSKLLSQSGATTIVTAGDLIDQGATTADLGTVSDDFLNAYPDFLAEFIDVLETATELYRQDPLAAAEAVAQEVNLSPAIALSIMKEIVWLDVSQQSDAKYMGTPDSPGEIAQVLKSSADFMASQKAIPPAPALETFQAALFNQTFAAETS